MIGKTMVVAAMVAGGMAVTVTPASAGSPITVVTTDAAPPGGKASFNPADGRLTVCDGERDHLIAVGRLRVERVKPQEVTVANGCRTLVVRVPSALVSLQVCLSRSATGPRLFCSEWKSTRT